MKRWALVTVVLYALALVLLTAPALLIGFATLSTAGKDGDYLAPMKLEEVWAVYHHWLYWLWLGVLVAGQAALLLLPLNETVRRPTARRPLWLPVIVSAFFLANLFAAGLLSILVDVFGDHVDHLFGDGKVGWVFAGLFSALGQLGTVALILLLFWALWAAVFRAFARSDEPDALLKRCTRWLLRGSILELLIAVPSHVIVRRRHDCCAPAATFWGISAGLSVMLLCFGPGVFFLFAQRFRRLRPKRGSNAV